MTVKITPYYDDEYIDTSNNIIYNYNMLNKTNIYYPKLLSNLPTDADYSKGYFNRYFYKLTANTLSDVYEINYAEYSKIINEPLYKKLKIKWKLVGIRDEVIKINTNIINVANNTLNGIKYKLINPLQYWKN